MTFDKTRRNLQHICTRRGVTTTCPATSTVSTARPTDDRMVVEGYQNATCQGSTERLGFKSVSITFRLPPVPGTDLSSLTNSTNSPSDGRLIWHSNVTG